MLNLVTRLLEQRRKLESVNQERVAQRFFHEVAIAPFGDCASFHVAHPKDGENAVVFARKNVCAQDIERNNRK